MSWMQGKNSGLRSCVCLNLLASNILLLPPNICTLYPELICSQSVLSVERSLCEVKQTSQLRSCGKVEARKELIKDHFKKVGWVLLAVPDDLLSRALKKLAGVTGEPLSSSYFWGQWVDGWGAWRLERGQWVLNHGGGNNDLGNQRLVKLFVSVPERMGASISFQASWSLLVYMSDAEN